MRKFFSLIAAVLFAGSMMAADATMAAGTNGSACTVNDVAGIKCGTSKAGGDMTITVGAGATKLSFYAAAWKGVTGLSLNLAADGVTISPASVSLTADDGISNNTPFTLAGLPENFKFEVDLTDVSAETVISVTSSAAKRFVVWGATYETGEGGGGETPVEPTMAYYVAGSMTNWGPMAAYKLAANPANEGEYMGEFTFAANDEFKVGYSDGTTIESTNYFPNGIDNNYVITEAGDYTVYFRPDGQGGEDWHYGCINAIKKEPVVIPQYEVAEAIAAGLTDDTEILVRGVITKMEFKGKNFAKYGSVNIYVADATGAEGEFEFYNCYSLEADTFRTSTPAYDAESTSWAQFTEVVDENQVAVHVGDTVIAFGKYKLYNTTHELNTGCYLTSIVPADSTPTAINNVAVEDKAVKVIREGQLFIMKNGVLYNAQGAIVK